MKIKKVPNFLSVQDDAVEAILMAPAEEFSCLTLKRTMDSLVAIHSKYKEACTALGMKAKAIRITWQQCLRMAIKYDAAHA